MIKICFIGPTLNTKTGWGRYCSEFIHEIKKDKEFNAFSIVEEGELGDAPILPKNKKNPIKLIRVLWKLKKIAKNYDIIHALDGWPFGFYGALLGKPLIITLVGTFAVAPLYRMRSYWFLKYAYKKANVLAAVSGYTAREVYKRINNLQRKIFVIKLGLDLNRFVQQPASYKKGDYILSVGTIEQRKGYHISIRAFAEVSKHYPNMKYIIVGRKDGKYFQQISGLIENMGLRDKISILKEIGDDQLLDLYKNAKLFLLHPKNFNHDFEGFGLVFLEAAASGLPIVATLGNGSEDSVANGFNGLLVEQGNMKQTAEAVLKILNDSSLYSKMVANSINWAKNNSWSRTASEYKKIYENLA